MATFGGINQGILRVSPTEMQLARGNPGMTPAYASMSALQRQAAERLGVAPANVQETVWSLTKPLMEKQAALNMPARDILQKGLLFYYKIQKSLFQKMNCLQISSEQFQILYQE